MLTKDVNRNSYLYLITDQLLLISKIRIQDYSKLSFLFFLFFFSLFLHVCELQNGKLIWFLDPFKAELRLPQQIPWIFVQFTSNFPNKLPFYLKIGRINLKWEVCIVELGDKYK